MPGIAGIIANMPKERGQEILGSMMECMIHEPFYATSSYANEDLGLYAGCVWHKEASAKEMPHWNETGTSGIIFSGENYPDSESIAELKMRGHRFDANGSEYLIHLYEEKGDEYFHYLNGLYSGILIDLSNGTGFLFNDRYGMQRIYYFADKEEFYFSSEAKCLLKIKPEARQLTVEGLGEFFSFGCVLNNRTLFKNIQLLPGGSLYTFRKGEIVKKGCYFKPESWESVQVLEKETYYEKMKSTFRNILPRYFSPMEKIGISLTGGLDTRMIMANVNIPFGTIPCYTFGGMIRDCSDVKVAREIAKRCKQDHQVIRVDQRFLSEFPKLAERTIYLSDGSMDVTGSPDLFVNKIAREIAPIRVTGNYGSEVLRSVPSFKPNPPTNRVFHHDFKRHVADAVRTYQEAVKGHRLSFIAFKQLPWYHHGRFVLEQSQLRQRSPFLDYDFMRNIYQAPPETTTENEMSFRLITDGNPELSGILTDRGLRADSNRLLSQCARLFLEFTFKAEYAYDYGMPQSIAKIDHALSFLHLERLFLGRHKFAHFRIWYRDYLSSFVKEMLLDDRTLNRAYLNRKFIEDMVMNHVNGTMNYTFEIHKVLTSELIQRQLIENF